MAQKGRKSNNITFHFHRNMSIDFNPYCLLMTTLLSYFHSYGHQGEFPLTKFLDGGPKCDVQLFLNGSEHLRFSPSFGYPTTIIYVPSFLQNFKGWHRFRKSGEVANFTLNTLQLRIGKGGISLFFNYWEYTVNGLNWLAAANRHSLRFNKVYIESKDATLILVGSSVALGQTYNFSRVNYEGALNLFLAFASENFAEFELCSFIEWQKFSTKQMNCHKKKIHPTKNLDDLRSSKSASCWLIDFESGLTMKTASSYRPTNPFDRPKNSSTTTKEYLFREVLHRGNTSLCQRSESWSQPPVIHR